MSNDGVEKFVRLLIADARFAAEAGSNLDSAMSGFDLTDEEKEYLAGRVDGAVLDFDDTEEHPQRPPSPKQVERAVRTDRTLVSARHAVGSQFRSNPRLAKAVTKLATRRAWQCGAERPGSMPEDLDLDER